MRNLLAIIVLTTSLFAAGADDKHEMMLLAIKKNDIAKVRTLLSQKLDPNARKDTRASPTFLTYAAHEGRTDLIRILLQAGASVDLPDGDMLTPLMQASWHGHLAAVELLLKAGASLNEVSKWGETALALARQGGHAAVVQTLEKAGAK